MPLWFRWLTFWILVALTLATWVLIRLLERAPDGTAAASILQNPSFLAALVAALVALILVVANRYADMGHAEHERRSREIKASIALATEIRTNLERQRLSFSERERRRSIVDVSRKAKPTPQASPPTTPTPDKVATVDQTNFVYESLRGEVLNLPVEIIGPVVEYYNLDDMLNRTLVTNQTARIAEPERKLKFFTELYKLMNECDRAAVRALSAIWHSLPQASRQEFERPSTAPAEVIQLADRLIGAEWKSFPTNGESRILALVRVRLARHRSVQRDDGTVHEDPPAYDAPDPDAPTEKS